MKQEEEIQQRYERVAAELDERSRRLVAAGDALSIGWGGVAAVSRVTGLSRSAITQGIKELQEGAIVGEGRVRRVGAGRKRTVSKDPSLREDLEWLIEPIARGTSESPLRWTSKSVRKLAAELQQMGHQVSHELVSQLLHERGYSLQGPLKTRGGGGRADRERQFEHLNAQAAAFLAAGEPVVALDAKKKESAGDCKNLGREWHPQGEAEEGRVYDCPIEDLGRATPNAVYELGRNAGWDNLGIDHETAAFAVASLRRWWNAMGQRQYPEAKRLLIGAKDGGSNGSWVRVWKWELQQLADETGLAISVCHMPSGTSKWNQVEHCLFAWISQNRRGKSQMSYAVILQLIAATTTQAGLAVQCQLDSASYPAGRKISEEKMAMLSIQSDSFYGEWNYTILPRFASIDTSLC